MGIGCLSVDRRGPSVGIGGPSIDARDPSVGIGRIYNGYRHRLLYTWTPHRRFLYCIRPGMGKRVVKVLHAFSGTNAGNDTCFLSMILSHEK